MPAEPAVFPSMIPAIRLPNPRPAVAGSAAPTLVFPSGGGYTIAKMLLERRGEFGVAWFLIDDLSRMSRNMIESLQLGELAADTGVRVVGASDGYDSTNPQSSLLLPVLGSMNEAFVSQLKAKVRRGMDDAFRRGDNIQPPGVGYRMVPVINPDGSPVITHKGTVEKRAEVDPEAAAKELGFPTQTDGKRMVKEWRAAVKTARGAGP
jgi:site-specific DNA recombinase